MDFEVPLKSISASAYAGFVEDVVSRVPEGGGYGPFTVRWQKTAYGAKLSIISAYATATMELAKSPIRVARFEGVHRGMVRLLSQLLPQPILETLGLWALRNKIQHQPVLNHWSRAFGRVDVLSDRSEHASLDAPDNFNTFVRGVFNEYWASALGEQFLSDFNRICNVSIKVNFKPRTLLFEPAVQTLWIDPAEATHGSYVGVGADRRTRAVQQPASICVVHELFHAFHWLENSGRYLARGARKHGGADADWDDEEEELTISGRLKRGAQGPVLSENHWLVRAGLPPRWGHDATAAGKLLTQQELEDFFGPNFLVEYAREIPATTAAIN